MPTWELIDADVIAAESPYTFYKPSREIIRKVAPGELVKLIFRFDSDDPEAPRAERMWVLVDEVTPNGDFKGKLDNTPKYITDLKHGDPIQFRACHIIDTEHAEADSLVERYIKRCLVTQRILRDKERVGYLYREEPEREDDSGWRIMAGDESDEYMDDSKNIAYVSLGAVLSRDDSFRELLDAPIGARYARDSESGAFVAED